MSLSPDTAPERIAQSLGDPTVRITLARSAESGRSPSGEESDLLPSSTVLDSRIVT